MAGLEQAGRGAAVGNEAAFDRSRPKLRRCYCSGCRPLADDRSASAELCFPAIVARLGLSSAPGIGR